MFQMYHIICNINDDTKINGKNKEKYFKTIKNAINNIDNNINYIDNNINDIYNNINVIDNKIISIKNKNIVIIKEIRKIFKLLERTGYEIINSFTNLWDLTNNIRKLF
jgi:archaellum component FlaC